MKIKKILYIEDSEEYATMVPRTLGGERSDLEFTIIESLPEIEEALTKGGFDLILSDFNLKGFDGRDVLKKRNLLAPDLPIIILTGALPDETAVELLRLGADDYVLKDRLARLPVAIDNAINKHALDLELRAARWEVEENAARFRDIFEASSDLIFTVSPGGKISTANPAFHAVINPGANGKTSYGIKEITAPQKTEGLFAAITKAAGEKLPVKTETVFLSSTGKAIEVEGTLYPRAKAGKDAYVQGLFRDVTAQRSMEAQFRQAQKMEAVGRLAGGIAHDFNNILGAIEGYATLTLNALKEEDPIRPDIEEIRRAVARAAALTRQLLIFSQKNALQKKICSAGAIIENLQSMVKRIIGEDIKLELQLQVDLPQMKADGSQIEQLLVNLLVNARDAMPGGGTITLRAQAKNLDLQEIKSPTAPESGCQFIVISVKDGGQGMSPETMEHIFEPFFTTKEKGKGTGLGLATVYGVVKQHNGWIEVKSFPGQGAEFTVYLPACPEAEEPAAHTSALPPPTLTPLKILIIEDDDALRNLAGKALREAGHATETARGAAEGLDLFRARRGEFDIVFSDLVLEDRKIIELVDDFVRINPGVNFIFTSGYLDDKTNLDLITARGYRFIPKPYAIDALLKTMHESIKK